ncbi:MAG: FAD-dependent oxidoreductase [Desulfobacterales bacterium]
MTEAVFMLGGLGILVGSVLAAASRIFYVYVDPKIEAVEDALPGANCGGCGLPGCSANAEAIVAGKTSAASCVAGGADLALEIAKIMGVSVEAKEPDIALPGCTYGVQDADLKYIYDGLTDCRAAALLNGGMKVCTIGCLGLGTCAAACPFDALQMGKDNLPVVNEERCTGCGTCERICPKHIIHLSSTTRRILREYTTEECTTPCQRACPAGINIREYIGRIAAGDYQGAIQTIKERNPFPAVIGRICPRPCEEECRRRYADESVAINFLKRYAADYEKENDTHILPYKAPQTGREVAVIGGGVEGLAAAFFTARLGHKAMVFEATSRLGGLLKNAISAYRLPQDILEWDIQGVIEMGVEVTTEKALGQDFSIESLLVQGYEAVFLASGGWDSRLARLRESDGVSSPETPVPGIGLLVDLIKNRDTFRGKSDIVIAGGGTMAIEAARVCKEKGSKNVTLLFRETHAGSSIAKADLKALADEGIMVKFQAGISRIFGEGDGLTAIEWIDLNSLTKNVLTAQNLILSAGRIPQLIFIKSKTEDSESNRDADTPLKWEAIEAYKQPSSANENGWLAKGDALTDFSAAIKAIGAGRIGAVSIHQMMYAITPTLPDKVITPDAILQNVDHVEEVAESPRHIMPLCRPADLTICGEAELGFKEETARAEASRCLKCGLICYERSPQMTAKQHPLKITA